MSHILTVLNGCESLPELCPIVFVNVDGSVMQLCPKQKAQDFTYAEPLHKLMVTEPIHLGGLELLGEVGVKVGEVQRYMYLKHDNIHITCLILGSH